MRLELDWEVALMHFISGKRGRRFHCYFSTSYSLKRTPLLPDLLLLKWVGNQQLRLPNLVRKDALMIPYCTYKLSYLGLCYCCVNDGFFKCSGFNLIRQEE